MRVADKDGKTVDRSEILPCFARDGLLRFSDCGVEELKSFMRTWTAPYSHPHETAPGVTIIRPLAATSAGEAGFTSDPLGLHTDRATTPLPPSILATLVMEQSEDGGSSLLLDGKSLVMDVLSGGSFSADLMLRTDAGELIPIFNRDSRGLCQIRYRDDDVARPYAKNASAASRLAAVRRSLNSSQATPMKVGEGYLIHNHRYLHGRTGFLGNRVVARLLATVSPESQLAYLNSGFDMRT